MRYFIFLCLCLFLINCSSRNTKTERPGYEAFHDSVTSVIEKHKQDNHESGIAIAVIHEDSIILNKGYGYASWEEKTPVSPQTVFNLASVSKSVTAIALLRLLRQERITLDTPVNNVLSEWKLPSTEEYNAEEVTIARLLNHTAGISLPSAPIIDRDSSISNLNNLLNSGDIRIEYEPGKAWNYSGGGYIILQKVIEEMSEKDFADYMDKKIFSNYSLASATFKQENIQGIRSLALPHEGNKEIPTFKIYGASAGGLYISMNDFIQYMCLYFKRAEQNKTDSFITGNLINRIISDTVKVNIEGVEGAYYGLGHGVHFSKEGDYILYHSGGNPGYLAYFLVMPEQKDAVAIFANNSASVPVLVKLLNFWSSYFDINIQPVY